MEVIIFFGLIINLFIQFTRKGHMHIRLYKELNLVDKDEDYAGTFLTGTFYKYPLAALPYVEKFENLGERVGSLYKKLKLQLYVLWFSILAFIGFFIYIFTIFE